MKFSRRIFQIAGIYGLVALVPMYFLESRLGRDFPPPISHPEYFYGFIGVATAWQVAFLILARDPVKYRLLMIPAVIEKFSYAGATLALFAAGRIAALVLLAGVVDLLLGMGFAAAFVKMKPTEN